MVSGMACTVASSRPSLKHTQSTHTSKGTTTPARRGHDSVPASPLSLGREASCLSVEGIGVHDSARTHFV